MVRLKSLALAGVCVAVLAACSSDPVEYEARPPEALYSDALSNLEQGNASVAMELFDEVDRQYPYSRWATNAQLMSAFAAYDGQKYDEAIIGLDRFIQLHPSHKDVAYARYLRALCYYEQISDVTRDQKMTEYAQGALRELIQRHPNTEYARDAQIKLDLTYDHLAGKEMEIGRYYQRWGHHLAAINRFQRVVDKFQTTTHVPEALHRLVESYTALGMVVEANRAAAVLGHNFPGNEWYEDTYEVVEGVRVRPRQDPEEPWYQFW
ncbi:MAG: outer membrane protein assembly factor BamD [Magnetospiraceae bacterium]